MAVLHKLDRLLGLHFCPDDTVNSYRNELESVQRRIEENLSRVKVIEGEIQGCRDSLGEWENEIPYGDDENMRFFERETKKIVEKMESLGQAVAEKQMEQKGLEQRRDEIEQELARSRKDGKVAALKFENPIQQSMYEMLCTWDSEKIKQVAEIRGSVREFLTDPSKSKFDSLCRTGDEDLKNKLDVLLQLFREQSDVSIDMSSRRVESNPAMVVEECFIAVLYYVFDNSSYDLMMRHMGQTIESIKAVNVGLTSVEKGNLYTVLSTMEQNGWFIES